MFSGLGAATGTGTAATTTGAAGVDSLLTMTTRLGNTCRTDIQVTATAAGGVAPYTWVWTVAWGVGSNGPVSRAYVPVHADGASVTVHSADGQSVTRGLYLVPWCPGGGTPP